MTNFQHPLIGARVHLRDAKYTGLAIVLEYDPSMLKDGNGNPSGLAGPFYCHLLELCEHEGTDEACDDPADDCMSDACRGWYAIPEEGQP